MHRVIWLAIVWLMVLPLVSSCGSDLQGPIQKANADPPEQISEETPQAFLFDGGSAYPVACYYYDPGAKDFGQGLFLYNNAWVYAKDQDDNWVYVDGEFRDGFYQVKEAYGRTTLGKRGNDVPANAVSIEELCRQSILKKFPGKNLKLYKVAAVESSVSPNEYTLYFKGPKMVVFGDSLSDPGNLKKWIRVFPASPYFLGDFSNGPVWPAFLSIFADMSILNWAFGGAVTAKNITADLKEGEIIERVKAEGRALVTGSVNNYVDKYVKKDLSEGKIQSPDDTIFFIWAGANDYISRMDDPTDADNMIDTPDEPGKGSNSISKASVNTIGAQVTKLYNLGARKFFLVNLPNLGLTPMVAQNKNYHKNDTKLSDMDRSYRTSLALSEISEKHNKDLNAEIARLKKALPQAQILFFDVFKAMDNMFAGIGPDGSHNFDYGLSLAELSMKITKTGYPDIEVSKPCYSGGYLGTGDLEKKVCPQIKTAFFWDIVHPTSIGHCGIAYYIHKTLWDNKFIAIEPKIDQYRNLCMKK